MSARKSENISLPVEVDERNREPVDDFIARNRGVLNESLARSRKEVAEGKTAKRTIEEIIAGGRRRAQRS